MAGIKEIIEAGRDALGLKPGELGTSIKAIMDAGREALGLPVQPPVIDPAAPAPAPPAPVIVPEEAPAFDPAAFGFEARPYRITFKGGTSGEYDGAVLARHFPFDVHQIANVEAL